MAVLITYNETLSFGGTFEPAFILKIVRSYYSNLKVPFYNYSLPYRIVWIESILR